MNKLKGGLGRGLDSLMGGGGGTQRGLPPSFQPVEVVAEEPQRVAEPQSEGTGWREISPDLITENPRQPRQYFDEEELQSLQDSIKSHGVLQPLVVFELPNGKFELIAGERRLRACRRLGLAKVPVIVREPAGDGEKLELALIENIQRHNLNPVEEALAYRSLHDDFGLRIEDIAFKVGKSLAVISNAIRILDLPLAMLEAARDGKISKSHARTLLAEPDPKLQRELFNRMLEGGFTVRQAENLAGARGKRRALMQIGKDPAVIEIETELRERLGTKVELVSHGGAGRVTIHFYSKDEMRELMEKLMRA